MGRAALRGRGPDRGGAARGRPAFVQAAARGGRGAQHSASACGDTPRGLRKRLHHPRRQLPREREGRPRRHNRPRGRGASHIGFQALAHNPRQAVCGQRPELSPLLADMVGDMARQAALLPDARPRQRPMRPPEVIIQIRDETAIYYSQQRDDGQCAGRPRCLEGVSPALCPLRLGRRLRADD